MLSLSVSLIVPVLAHFVELEPYVRLWITDRDLLDPGRNRVFIDTFVRRHVSKCLHLWLTVRIAQQILCPSNCVSAIAPVKPVLVAWEMAATKLLIAADKMYRMELSRIRATPSTGMTRSPARIDQLPMAVINLHHIPGMARCIFSRQRGSGSHGLETKAFAMTADDHAFQSSF